MDVLPLEGVNDGLDRLRSGQVVGRLVLDLALVQVRPPVAVAPGFALTEEQTRF
jgi:hypothetical protein